MAEESSARLLRAIAEELAQRFMPELSSADTRERAALARLVLEHLAADIDVLAVVAAQWIPAFRAALEEVLQTLPPALFAEQLQSWRADLAGIPIEYGAAREREVRALRTIAAALVRRATDLAGNHGGGPAADAAITQTLGRLGALDHQWLTRYDAARQQKDEPMYKDLSVTVIIPCLNEELGIEKILRAMPECRVLPPGELPQT